MSGRSDEGGFGFAVVTVLRREEANIGLGLIPRVWRVRRSCDVACYTWELEAPAFAPHTNSDRFFLH